MDSFPDRVSRFLRAARQLPNNAAATRDHVEDLARLDPGPEHGSGLSATDRAILEQLDRWEAARLDEHARALVARSPSGTGASPEAGLCLATIADDTRVGVSDEDIAERITSSITLTASSGQPGAVSGGGRDIVLRTPEPLGWRRSVHVLVSSAPNRYALLHHPRCQARTDAIAELHAAITGVPEAPVMACGTVLARDEHDNAHRADGSVLALVDTAALRHWFDTRHLNDALTTSLGQALAASGEAVQRIPRILGELAPRSPARR